MQTKGLVIKAIASFFYCEVNGKVVECRASSKLKRFKQQIITGDYVMFDDETNYITTICERENELIRPKIANVFNAMLIFSAIEPKMSFGLLDKMLLIMELNNLDSTIVITKTDLLNEEKKTEIKSQLEYYNSIGYKVYYAQEDLDLIKKALKKDKYVFTGQTGVGKSTLINKIIPDSSIKTQEISKALGRGKHTTREVTFYWHENSYIIDTPGFSALDINYTKEDVRDNYVDFKKLSDKCRFNTCYHLKEPNCEIKKTLDEDPNYTRRYNNYVKIIQEIGEKR